MVKIYLRSIVIDQKNSLAMFDTSREGAIDKLETRVPLGDMVIWKLDRCSGIKSITKISSKYGKRNVFNSDPRKRFLCKGFKFRPSKTAPGEVEEYNIEYILRDGTKVVIDPCIRIDPPQINK